MGLCEEEATSELGNQPSFESPSSPNAVGAGAIGEQRAAVYAGVKTGKGTLYPLRPSEPDCAYFLRTGSCKFGPFCRFNHPRERKVAQGQCRNSVARFQVVKEMDKGSIKPVDQICKVFPFLCWFGGLAPPCDLCLRIPMGPSRAAVSSGNSSAFGECDDPACSLRSRRRQHQQPSAALCTMFGILHEVWPLQPRARCLASATLRMTFGFCNLGHEVWRSARRLAFYCSVCATLTANIVYDRSLLALQHATVQDLGLRSCWPNHPQHHSRRISRSVLRPGISCRVLHDARRL